jgi:hypothetical protein
LSIKDLFDAVSAHAFIVHQRFKLVFQQVPFIGFQITGHLFLHMEPIHRSGCASLGLTGNTSRRGPFRQRAVEPQNFLRSIEFGERVPVPAHNTRTIIALHANCFAREPFIGPQLFTPLHVSNATEAIMLAPELAVLLEVMAFILLFVFAVLDSARLGLTARTEHIARSIGARMLG